MNLLLAYAAIPYLVTLGISVALSAAAYFLLKPKGVRNSHGNTQTEDFGLSNIATQGAYVPLLIGRRRIGAVVAWVGDRNVVPDVASTARGGAKGSRGSKRKTIFTGVNLYRESAWHLLCVGPAQRIHRIWAEGKLIYPTAAYPNPIDRDTSPSGSTFALDAGVFRVFWGENDTDQPVNTFLADANRVGVASRWPHVCYIEWTSKWLGQSPHWPQIEYDVEVLPQTAGSGIDEAVGTVPPYKVVDDGGSPAETLYEGALLPYALTQILLESYPHGVGLPISELDYDLAEPPAGPAIYLPFNEGDLVTDHSGNGRDMVAGGTVSETEGRFGGGAAVEGYPSSGNYLTRGVNDTVFDIRATPNEGFTVAFWIRPASAAGYSTLLRKFTTGSGPGWIMILEPGPGRIYLFWSPNANFYTSATIPVDEWTHVVLRVDATIVGAPVQWWINGVQDATASSYVDPGASTDHLRIADNTGVPGAVWYDGDFDEVAIYPRGLSDEEIQSLYAGGSPTGSLFELIQLADAEGLVGSVLARDGEEAGVVLGTILQDLGSFMPRVCDGRIGFMPIRQVDPSEVIELHEDQELPALAEIETVHLDRHVDRAMFSFPDVDRQFRETVIQIDDDGQPLLSGNVRGQVLPVATVKDYLVAAKVAERRSQEELAGGARLTFFMARGAHRLLPGRVITIPSLEGQWRVVEVGGDDRTGRTQVEAVLDHYGAPAATYEQESIPTSGGGGVAPAENLRKSFIEIPEHAGDPGLVQVAPLRIRAHDQIQAQEIHLSADGSTYVDVIGDGHRHTGGLLTSGVAIDDPWVIEQGPTFDRDGPADDLTDLVEDLSSNESAWRAGRQLVVIDSEIFFLRGVTALGGGSYRLDGLIRARFDTQRAAHAIGATAFILLIDQLSPVADPLIYPGATVYMKQQPFASSALDLASVGAVSKTILGKGLVPMRPASLRVHEPQQGVPRFDAGEDVVFRWAYRSSEFPGTGAGMQPAGSAVGVSAVRGTFEVSVYDAGDTLVATYDVGQATEWTYENTDIQADLGGEATFKVEVRNVNGGWRSEPTAKLTVNFAA